jgi:hypothetical protein
MNPSIVAVQRFHAALKEEGLCPVCLGQLHSPPDAGALLLCGLALLAGLVVLCPRGAVDSILDQE